MTFSEVDVLLCCHSQSEYHDELLRETLESLNRQTYKDFNIVAVLDECHEPTKEVCESFDDALSMQIFEKPKKTHLAEAKNFGLARCTAPLIVMQDADDISLDCRIKIQKDFMDTRQDIDALFSLAWDINEDGSITPSCFPVGRIETSEDIKWSLQYENVLCHSTGCIRSSAFDRIGGYVNDVRSIGAEDFFTWRYMLHYNLRFWQLQERLIQHRLNSSVPR